MTFADQKEIFTRLRRCFGEQAQKAVERKIGDSASLIDFWFDWHFGKPSVCFKYKADGREATKFVELER